MISIKHHSPFFQPVAPALHLIRAFSTEWKTDGSLVKMYVDGKFINSSARESISVINPVDLKLLRLILLGYTGHCLNSTTLYQRRNGKCCTVLETSFSGVEKYTYHCKAESDVQVPANFA